MRTYPGTYVTGTGSGENPLLKKHYHEMPLEIVYEDNYLVVINKTQRRNAASVTEEKEK